MVRCSCIKKDNKRCTREAKISNLYCWQHQNCQKSIGISVPIPRATITSRSIGRPTSRLTSVPILNKELFNDESEWTSLNSQLDEIKKLMSQGADIHTQSNNALILASKNGQLGAVKFLLNNGADIHTQNDLALRIAAQYGHLEIVKLLSEKGANCMRPMMVH